ncbi:putative elongator complex protein 1 [Friedmanniomyces endolithicus]|uniref:Elongator complex protein 1 n=1 Tax=Friedmanniomyces endolithicus TaxID=329885 RepID=A0AAN6JL82_9PEZI|nr:putative elongator complex protein 1 [Friedmanniomyces endolithicus]
MRNLRATRDDALAIEGISAIAYDLDNVVFALGPDAGSSTITLRLLLGNSVDPKDAATIVSWDVDPGDQVLNLHCFPDNRTISVVFAGGNIVTVRQEPLPGEDQIEIVGSVDAGIAAAAWSPDEESVAIATKADTLLLMTRDFEPTANITLSPEDLRVSSHVSVRWGKKETQFKGRGAAKALRDPTMPEHVDEGTLSPLDDKTVNLSWRGDGQYFALSSISDSEPACRVIRMYSREGVLESVSEPVNGLESGLSWKPSGQTVAGVRRSAEGLQVVFFERNGLRHGEFDLRLTKEESETIGRSVRLRWNIDSTVLAVALADRVQLWTVSNYHWYLKQEVYLNDARELKHHADLIWHPERPLREASFNDSELRLLDYAFVVSRGSVVPPNDHGLVAVIDGKQLKITPLRTANVPPPLAFDEIELPETANEVAFDRTGTGITVVHANQDVTRWEFDYSTKPIKRASLQEHNPHDKQSSPGTLAQRVDTLPIGDELSLSSTGVLGSRNQRIPGVTSYIMTPTHLIFTTSNHLLKFVHLEESCALQVPPDEPEKDERCRNIERGAKIVTVMPSAYSLVLQMPRGNLETIYPRALVLAGIRQSIVDRDYKKAFLTCRAQRVDMNILHDYAPEQFMRDAPLFLKQVKRPEYIDLFLSSLSEDNVAETIYKDTLITTPGQPLQGRQADHGSKASQPTSGKTNRICDAFLRELRQQSTSIQNVVTAHVCKSPPDLEAGLTLISDLRKQQKQEQLEAAVEHICFLADVNQLYDTALGLYDMDVALLVAQQSQKDPREYLPYLQGLSDMQPLRQQYTVDNDLKRYRKALARLHSIGEFEELKEYMAKHELYSASVDLYRYDSARLSELMRLFAAYLCSRNRYKEAGIAYEYVQDHSSAYEAYRSAGLWQECLASAGLVPVSDEELLELATNFVASLEEAKDYKAAATVQVGYLSNVEAAVRLLCKSYHFSEATRLASLHRKPELLRSVIDPGLVDGSASMTEMLAEMKSQLNAQVPRLRDLRLKKLEDPLAFIDGADGGDVDIPDNLSLAPTDASTTGTFMTRYTNRSTGTLATDVTRKTHKNRRREERKRARGKKGTVYEEEYLVNSIARLVERLNAVSEDVSRLVEGLMRRGMRERALAVDAAMQEVSELCRNSLDDVFVSNGESVNGTAEPKLGDEDARRPWGGQGVLWDALATTGDRRDAPVLKVFERLSLLA